MFVAPALYLNCFPWHLALAMLARGKCHQQEALSYLAKQASTSLTTLCERHTSRWFATSGSAQLASWPGH